MYDNLVSAILLLLIVIVVIVIIIINGATAQSRALVSLTGFVTVRYITMWVIILIQPPETSSGEATIDI
jgi:hypothetical protein